MKYHIPILSKEIVEYLIIKPKGIYMDCTVGFGGHSEKILDKLKDEGKLLGTEIDPFAMNKTNKKLCQHYKNFSLYNCSYINFPQILDKNKINKVDGFLFDLGISSYQVDSAQRGFSYLKNGPLDMRFDCTSNSKSAKDLLMSISEDELSFIIKEYGQEKYHKRISNKIINGIKKNQINTTFDLKNIICKTVPAKNNIKVLSRVFQAIRIVVNDEINEFKETLKMLHKHLNRKGRIAILTFHSIEDRVVKHFFKDSVLYKNSTYDIEYKVADNNFKLITKKPITPSKDEIKNNLRCRSAKLRVAEII